MAYVDVYNLRYESVNLSNRAEVAVTIAARDVLSEDPATDNHANRVIWAHWALANSRKASDQMMWGLVANSTVQTNGDSTSDNDIQFVINSLIDSFADGSQ
jgi:hypothetical protein